ncbi:DUF3077 domain-containing protein [Pseudomonas akapageensis]|uniref:DUF3077 domain-containing protein n=1 Tax=Pseudomonas akapageensis TaxID=2609961 RepID=UPI001408431D|nr:DUF3077 domain-containing protein [Pseudomonas akapageensis]
MIKIVPDPPLTTLQKTVTTPFGICDAGHEPLFAVRAGIPAEDALVHASLLLKGACASTVQACEKAATAESGLLWLTLHAIETAKALVDAVVDGVQCEEHTS